jgi:hypothetical protein
MIAVDTSALMAIVLNEPRRQIPVSPAWKPEMAC